MIDRAALEAAVAQALYDQGMGDFESDLMAARVMANDRVMEALGPTERCAFVYTSAEEGGTPCPFTRAQHPLLHPWFDR